MNVHEFRNGKFVPVSDINIDKVLERAAVEQFKKEHKEFFEEEIPELDCLDVAEPLEEDEDFAPCWFGNDMANEDHGTETYKMGEHNYLPFLNLKGTFTK